MLTDLGGWLEPGLRWRIDEGQSKPEEQLVARLWEKPGASSRLVVDLEPSEDGGTTVTVTEQLDRHFDLDTSLTSVRQRPGFGRASASLQPA